MTRFVIAVVAAMTGAGALAFAQEAPTPFKLGTFERQGRPFVGIVLRESVVIDFTAAHAAIRTPASTVTAPTDMKDLIVRYDQGLRTRIVEIVRTVTAAATARPAYVYDLTALKVLPPIMYPRTLLNVAVNYREHDIEMNTLGADGRTALGGVITQVTGGAAPEGTRSAPGIWERSADDKRWNPYMFLKAPAAIVADGEAVRIPPNRTQIDWECELGVVIGRTAEQVPAARAGGVHLRLHAPERRVGSRRTRRSAVWIGLVADEVARDVCSSRSVHYSERVHPRPEKHERQVHAQRPADAGRQHEADDSRRLRAGGVRLQHPAARGWRRDRDREPGRRRLGAQPADLPQEWRSHVVHVRRCRALSTTRSSGPPAAAAR